MRFLPVVHLACHTLSSPYRYRPISQETVIHTPTSEKLKQEF